MSVREKLAQRHKEIEVHAARTNLSLVEKIVLQMRATEELFVPGHQTIEPTVVPCRFSAPVPYTPVIHPKYVSTVSSPSYTHYRPTSPESTNYSAYRQLSDHTPDSRPYSPTSPNYLPMSPIYSPVRSSGEYGSNISRYSPSSPVMSPYSPSSPAGYSPSSPNMVGYSPSSPTYRPMSPDTRPGSPEHYSPSSPNMTYSPVSTNFSPSASPAFGPCSPYYDPSNRSR